MLSYNPKHPAGREYSLEYSREVIPAKRFGVATCFLNHPQRRCLKKPRRTGDKLANVARALERRSQILFKNPYQRLAKKNGYQLRYW
jgi:hypothetical protein